MLHCLCKFWIELCCHLLKKCSQVDTGLCRTTTPSIHHPLGRTIMGSIGGTPHPSPDLNPIENLWHELKEFIRREINPKTKDELINGILRLWEIIDFIKCDPLWKNQPLALKYDFAVGGSILDSTLFFRIFLFIP